MRPYLCHDFLVSMYFDFFLCDMLYIYNIYHWKVPLFIDHSTFCSTTYIFISFLPTACCYKRFRSRGKFLKFLLRCKVIILPHLKEFAIRIKEQIYIYLMTW